MPYFCDGIVNEERGAAGCTEQGRYNISVEDVTIDFRLEGEDIKIYNVLVNNNLLQKLMVWAWSAVVPQPYKSHNSVPIKTVESHASKVLFVN